MKARQKKAEQCYKRKFASRRRGWALSRAEYIFRKGGVYVVSTRDNGRMYSVDAVQISVRSVEW